MLGGGRPKKASGCFEFLEEGERAQKTCAPKGPNTEKVHARGIGSSLVRHDGQSRKRSRTDEL